MKYLGYRSSLETYKHSFKQMTQKEKSSLGREESFLVK